MSILEELQAESRNAANVKEEMVDEIVNYFRKYFNSEKFEAYVKKSATETKENILNREAKFYGSFHNYSCGCGDTSFMLGGALWLNPVNHGWDSQYYKGIELKTIHKEICYKIKMIMIDRLKTMGFSVSVNESENRFGEWKSTITIHW